MNKVYIYSDMFLPTFPYLELPLYRYLEQKYIDVTYILHEKDVRLSLPEVSEKFKKLNLVTVSGAGKVVKAIDRKANSILVSRFAYKGDCGKAAEQVKSVGHKVFMYDPSGIDIRVRQCPAHYLTAKSKTLKLATLKKFPKAYKNIFTTGTIHYDAVATTFVDKTEFMERYGLDPNKKLLLLTPANPGELGHQHGVNNEYTEIVRIVKEQCPDYELMVKAHPLDYTASMPAQPGVIHKNEHYKGKHSWEQFAPGINVVKAEEGYEAIKVCDAVLNVRSSIAMETPLFPKPLININRSKYTTNWPFAEGVMMDVEMGELAVVLNTNSYFVDEEACKQYCKEHCFSDDGKAFERTGDAIIKVLNGEV